MSDQDDAPDGEIDPTLLRWLPVKWHEWILPPLLLIVLAVIVLLAARGHTSSEAAHRLDLGWRVAAVAGIVAALCMAPFAHRAYEEVSEESARRYRKATGIVFVSLGVVLLVTGIVSNNTFLASATILSLWPLAARLRSLVLRVAEQDPARGRRIATRVLVVAVLVILLAIALAFFGSSGFATTYVISNAFVYGPVVAIGAAITRREIGRPRAPQA